METAIDNEKAGHLRAANFNKTYVKEEIFPKSLGHRIAIAEEVRHNSDYDEFYIVSREETEKQIQTATELINEVEKFLNKKQEKS